MSSHRLKPFSRADLVSLAGRINTYWGSAPPDGLGAITFDYPAGVAFDAETVYSIGTIVQSPEGWYAQVTAVPPTWDDATEYNLGDWVVYGGLNYYCTTDATVGGDPPGTGVAWVHPAQGLPCTHGDYYFSEGGVVLPLSHASPDPQNWIAAMNRCRGAVKAAVEASANSVSPASAVGVFESALVSGPWPYLGRFYTSDRWGGVLPITAVPLLSYVDSASRPCSFYYYTMRDFELYSYRSDCRIDLLGSPAGQCQYFTTADGDEVFWYESSWTGALVSGHISVFCVVGGFSAPASAVSWTGDATYDDTTGELRWEYSAVSIDHIQLNATVVGGNFVPVLAQVDVELRWVGGAASLASNVLSDADVYRAVQTGLPRIYAVLREQAGLGDTPPDYTITSYNYADGAPCGPIVLKMINPNTTAESYMLRAKTQPVWGVCYADPAAQDAQRHWYPTQRRDDARAITFDATQSGILEIDALSVRRLGTSPAQHEPVVDRTDLGETLTEVSADIGFIRDGETTWRSLRTVTVDANRAWTEELLDRDDVLVRLDTLQPLRWDGAAVLAQATALVGVNVPAWDNGYTWTEYWSPGGDHFPVTPLGFAYTSAWHLDDLNAVLDAL